MSLQQRLEQVSLSLPVRLMPEKDGTLAGEAILAERKAFLSKKKLQYRCRVRVDESSRTVRFWEMLVEKGSGLSSGSSGGFDEMSPGFGFKKETYTTRGKEREGTIEEVSQLFGKNYSYAWDYGTVRQALRAAAEAEGYRFETVLREKSV
ncbi:MAG: hypothetical protein H5T84_00955 [Thermoleophilia bacterium]|nr:hypothetical protein [Thermoleophilia bacterium]